MGHFAVQASRASAASSLFLALFAAPAAAQCGDEVVLEYLDAGTAAPLLRTPHGAPVVGGAFAFRVHGGPPLALGIVLYSGFENPVFDPVLAALVWPEPPWFAWFFGTNALGDSPLVLNTTEVTPDLCGAQATFQAVVFDALAPGGLVISNAVRLRVGESRVPRFSPTLLPLAPASAGSLVDIAVADLDGDGIDDLALFEEGRFSVRPGDAQGWFGASVSHPLPSSGGRSLTLADFDGDGRLDALTTHHDADVIVVALGDGEFGFAGAATFATGNGPSGADAGDIDLDGVLDVAVANDADSVLSVFRGNGGGFFLFPNQVFAGSGPGGSGPSDVVIADVDEDGLPDLVAAVAFAELVSVLRGTGGASFAAPLSFASPGTPLSIAVGDFDGDTHLDVAIAHFSASDVGVRLGNGTGALGTEIRYAAGSGSIAVSARDLDGDRDLDLAVLNQVSADVTLLAGSGGGTFAHGPDVFCGGIPVALELVDMDRDERVDLAVGRSGVADFVAVALGNGDGTFREGVSGVVGGAPSAIAAGRIDLDLDADLLVADAASGTVAAHLGNGDGTFGAAVPLASGGTPSYVLLADVDGDGFQDALFANAGANTVSVRLGNGNGTFDPAAVASVGLAPRKLVVGDVNGDLELDVLVANFQSDSVSVLRGNGDGTFAPATSFAVADGPAFLELLHLNADAALDLVVGNTLSTPGVAVRLGLGNGTFGAPATVALAPFADLDGLTLADLNADGVPDLVTTLGSFVGIALGNGLGGFGPLAALDTGVSFLERVKVADVSGDDAPDVVAASPNGSAVVVIVGNPDGSVEIEPCTAGAALRDFALEDCDGDGVLDVVAVSADRIEVLINRSGE